MPRALTNKQRVVLGVLQRSGEEMTVDEIAGVITNETPCGECGGGEPVGEVIRRYDYEQHDYVDVCGRCYGRGHAFFHYSTAYQALQRLRKEGLVSRRCKRDEWGDELPLHVYRASPVEPDPADPLEQAWRLEAQRS